MADTKAVRMRRGGEEAAGGNSREGRITAHRDAGTNRQLEPTASAKGLSSEDILDYQPVTVFPKRMSGPSLLLGLSDGCSW